MQAARLTGLAIVPGTVTIAADDPPAVAHQLALGSPWRLVIDLPAGVDRPLVAAGAGSVTRLRAANFAPGVARLVIDLSAPVAIVAARRGAGGLTITLRRITEAEFAAAVARGRRPLPVLPGGPVVDGAPVSPGPVERTPAVSVPPRTASGFDLPDDMFTGLQRTPATGTDPAKPAPAPPPASAVPDGQPPPSGAAGGDLDSSGGAADVAERPDPAVPAPRRAGIRARSGGKPLVVIDAGHGGKDVGAISVTGGYEKDVTLAIARAAAAALERSGRVRVKLTRADDRFIPLGGRVTIARQARADLFISIHADAAGNPQARGASIYTLSAVASDAIAARLAARENKADIIGGVNFGLIAPDVGDIMIDLSRRATTNVSVAFAETLQETLSDRIAFRSRFHHFAGFWVLKAPDVPSVLFETGYVTNSDDAEMLFSKGGRRKVAEGIARAVERHLLGD